MFCPGILLRRRIIAVRIAGTTTGNRMWYVPSIILECCRYTNLLVSKRNVEFLYKRDYVSNISVLVPAFIDVGKHVLSHVLSRV